MSCGVVILFVVSLLSHGPPIISDACLPAGHEAKLCIIISLGLSMPLLPSNVSVDDVLHGSKKNCPDLVSFVGVCCADRSDVCRTLAVTTLLAVVV